MSSLVERLSKENKKGALEKIRNLIKESGEFKDVINQNDVIGK